MVCLNVIYSLIHYPLFVLVIISKIPKSRLFLPLDLLRLWFIAPALAWCRLSQGVTFQNIYSSGTLKRPSFEGDRLLFHTGVINRTSACSSGVLYPLRRVETAKCWLINTPPVSGCIASQPKSWISNWLDLNLLSKVAIKIQLNWLKASY